MIANWYFTEKGRELKKNGIDMEWHKRVFSCLWISLQTNGISRWERKYPYLIKRDIAMDSSGLLFTNYSSFTFLKETEIFSMQKWKVYFIQIIQKWIPFWQYMNIEIMWNFFQCMFHLPVQTCKYREICSWKSCSCLYWLLLNLYFLLNYFFYYSFF